MERPVETRQSKGRAFKFVTLLMALQTWQLSCGRQVEAVAQPAYAQKTFGHRAQRKIHTKHPNETTF